VKREDGCLTGEKMTDGRDGLLRGEGRAGLATADLLYAAAAAEARRRRNGRHWEGSP
jgi:hypothetical protein